MVSADDNPRHPDLTPRQQSIVRFVEDYFARIGYPPTLREIATAVGLKSPSSAHYQVTRLKQKERLSHDFGRPRTTKPRGPARTVVPLTAASLGSREGSLIPVVGRVAAGGTVTAMNLTGQTDEYVSVPPGIASAPHEYFALEVTGDSMIGRAILDGDRVVVRYGSEARNNDIVVAQFRDTATSPEEDEGTIKTYKRLGGRVWLMPENSAYAPIPGDQAKILGRVVHLSRTLG
jgi:repressor LexA